MSGELLVEPGAATALDGARAVVVLVGSYDGSANYGDIAQYVAAAELAASVHADVALVTVLEAAHRGTHHDLSRVPLEPVPTVPLWFTREPGGEHADALVRAELPVSAELAALYLYGGGYLNPAWGATKVAHLAAVEDLCRRARVPLAAAVSSGLQVHPAWAEGLDPAGRRLLGGLASVGVRDAASGRAAAPLGLPVVETGDDAVAVVGRLAPAGGARATAAQVNVHVADMGWVTEHGATLPFAAGLLAELLGPDGRAQPVLAYDDPRTSERAPAARLVELAAERGVATERFAPQVLLRPAGLQDDAPVLARAQVTLSCSYHVALTSLLLGVPAVLLAENEYYRQKAAGLREDFGLPEAFAPDPASDPVEVAAAVRAALADPGLAERLEHGRERQLARRAAAEEDLRARLRAALAPALDVPAPAPAAALAPADEAAHELALLRGDHEALARAAAALRGRVRHLERSLSAARALAPRLAEAEAAREEIWAALEWERGQHAATAAALEQARAERDGALRAAGEAQAAAADAAAERDAAVAAQARLGARVAAVEQSRSWTLTRPLRAVAGVARRARGRAR